MSEPTSRTPATDGSPIDSAAATIRPFIEEMNRAEERLGVPSQTLSSLMHGSDWAFAIQIAALIESALGHAIRAAMNDSRIESIIDGLSIRGRLSKLAFARALKLIDDDTARAIDGFAVLRNYCAHDPSAISISLHTWLHNQSDPRAEIRKLIAIPVQNPAILDRVLASDATALKLIIWTSGVATLTAIMRARDRSEADARLQRAFEDLGRRQSLDSDAVLPQGPARYESQ